MGRDDVEGLLPVEEQQDSKLVRKLKEWPAMGAGLVGMFGIIGYNMYRMYHRPKGSRLQLYIIHTRVYAQGFIISCLTLSVCYKMVQDHLIPRIRNWRQPPKLE